MNKYDYAIKLTMNLFAAALAATLAAHGAAFTPGNIVVDRIGGGGTLSSTSTNVFLDEFTTAGSPVQSLAMPSASGSGLTPYALSESGTASSDGFITRSTNGQCLVVSGYTNNVGLAGSPAALNGNKVVGIVWYDGTIETRTLVSTLNGNNIRSASSTDGTNIWVSGGAGVAFVTNGQTTASTALSAQNSRALAIADGQLYWSSGSGALRVGTVGTGLPTTAGQSLANLPGLYTAGGGPFQFALLDLTNSVSGVDTLYVADTFGIVKWSLVGGNWTSNGTINAGVATAFAGLTASNDASGVVTIFATLATGATLSRFVDGNGYNAGVSGVTTTLLATASAGTVFRGVAFAPAAAQAPASSIGVSGSLNFGNVATGTTANATLTITNSGTALFTVTNIVFPVAFTSAWTGVVSPGSASNVTVIFSPDALAAFGGTISVQSDATTGSGQISCSGTGIVLNPPPVVVITSPTNGAITGPSVAISATTTDDGTVTNVAFYADGNFIGAVTNGPYDLTWNSAPTGSHSLAAVARDDLGAVSTSAIVTITVKVVPTIKVTSNIYQPLNVGMTNGTWVYFEADPSNASPMRPTQRSLGYREVDYKAKLFSALSFAPVAPTTNGTILEYDYSAQNTAAVFTVGYWKNKDLPVLIGPDGNAYITDGHHTSAGYLSPFNAQSGDVIPGQHRIVLGHIVTNFFNVGLGPQPADDTWWTNRLAENNAFLYGTNGNQLALAADPGYAGLQPILPGLTPMPITPSTLGTNAMTHDPFRGLTWGMADGIVKAASNGTTKIKGYSKTNPDNGLDINFVEFFWADYFRNRIAWDDGLSGHALGSGSNDANAISAPLAFFAAVANGIAFARSQDYRDQYGRGLLDYTNSAIFSPNSVRWAAKSIANGSFPAGTNDIYNLFLLDGCSVIGDINPSSVALANILHIDTTAGMTVTNRLLNLRDIVINAGGTLVTAWKDAVVTNSTLTMPAGTNRVILRGTNTIKGIANIAGGLLLLDGKLTAGALNLNVASTLELVLGFGSSITATNTATIAGSLNTAFASGYTGTYGNAYAIISATSIGGTFAATNLPAIAPTNVWSVQYTATSVVLSIIANPLTAPAISGVTNGAAVAQMPLTGGVNPGGLQTTVYFEFGPTVGYGSQTAQTVLPIGTTVSNVSLTATGLVAGLTYHYHLVASNSLGITTGPDMTFIASGVAQGDINGNGIISQAELDGVLANYWPNTVQYITNFVYNGGGRFSVQLPNPGNWGFTVQSTTDFFTWTNTTLASPAYQFVDPAFPAQTNRSYRLQWP